MAKNIGEPYKPEPFQSCRVISTYYKSIVNRLKDVEKALDDIEELYNEMHWGNSPEVERVAEFLQEMNDQETLKDYCRFMQLSNDNPRMRTGITVELPRRVKEIMEHISELNNNIWGEYFEDVD